MSRRLRKILLRRNLALGRPSKTTYLIEQSWPKTIREKLDRVYKAAGVERHKLKDFRDSYASILVQHGIVLKWISLQLGHANVGVTERHYARWMAQDGYRNPWLVPEVSCQPISSPRSIVGKPQRSLWRPQDPPTY